MEKLQAALEKARQRRMTETPSRTPDPKPPRGPRANGTQEDVTADDSVWAQLPELQLTDRSALRGRVFLDQKSAEASYFDKLRTKILQQCRDNEWKRVVITSATQSCGKTTICANLAASFTRQLDRKMLLLDLDMRRPELARIFGHRAKKGFSDVLEGEADFAEASVRFGQTVAISMNQSVHPNPAQLMLRDSTPDVLHEIEARYAPDLMVFDTPPLLSTDDTMAVLKHVDCAIVVAAAEMSTIEHIDTVEKELAEQTNVMGVVLNRCIYLDNVHAYYQY